MTENKGARPWRTAAVSQPSTRVTFRSEVARESAGTGRTSGAMPARFPFFAKIHLQVAEPRQGKTGGNLASRPRTVVVNNVTRQNPAAKTLLGSRGRVLIISNESQQPVARIRGMVELEQLAHSKDGWQVGLEQPVE